MRNAQRWCVHLDLRVQENIDINSAGTSGEGMPIAGSAQIALDSLQDCEELQRKQASLTLHNYVQEPGLVGHILRLGFVNGRAVHNLDVFLCQAAEGVLKIPSPITKVRSEGQIDLVWRSQYRFRTRGSARRQNASAEES